MIYRATAVYGQYIGVRVGQYESEDYLLVGRDGVDRVSIGDTPVASPGGARFFVLVLDPTTGWGPTKGAAIWAWRPHPQRLRLVDEAIVYVSRLIAWRGESCVEMMAADTEMARDEGGDFLVWLAEQDGDWRLTRRRPPICKG